MRWEYKVEDPPAGAYGHNGMPYLERMATLGQMGWELIQITQYNGDRYSFCYKRLIVDETDK